MQSQSRTLSPNSKRLRHDQTDAGRKLWMHLRSRQMNGAKFRRQQPIGRYIVDFVCPESKLVVELDGGHHALQNEADQRRTDFLTKAGYRVLRFWDNEVLSETEAVLQKIADELNVPPHPALSLQGRGYRKDNPLPQGARVKKRVLSSQPSSSRGEKKLLPLTLPSPSRGEGSRCGARELERADR